MLSLSVQYYSWQSMCQSCLVRLIKTVQWQSQRKKKSKRKMKEKRKELEWRKVNKEREKGKKREKSAWFNDIGKKKVIGKEGRKEAKQGRKEERKQGRKEGSEGRKWRKQAGKEVGGGFILVLIWSTYGIIEIVDHIRRSYSWIEICSRIYR